jgi:hypothetical protein
MATSAQAQVTGSLAADSDYRYRGVSLSGSEPSARASFSPDYYGQGTRTAYLEANLYPPLDRNLRLFAHVGALIPFGGATGDASKTRFDASVGVGLALGAWDLHVAAIGASAGGPYPAVYSGRRATLVVGAAVFF